jgi:hypothetical protein
MTSPVDRWKVAIGDQLVEPPAAAPNPRRP